MERRCRTARASHAPIRRKCEHLNPDQVQSAHRHHVVKAALAMFFK
jgi:hypothetical protein